MDNSEFSVDNTLGCIETINSEFPGTFILIGGASLIKYQSNRMTNDIDVLIPRSTKMAEVRQALISTGRFCNNGGVLFVTPSDSVAPSLRREMKLDITHDIVFGKGFDDLINHTAVIGDNVVLTLSMSLGIKLGCWYLRAEDENGMNKKETDMQDILFCARLLQTREAQVDSDAAAELKISHYNLLLIRLELIERGDDVELLRSVGCSKFLQKYEDNTPDQREYYEACGAKAGSDPLIVEIEYDSDEEEMKGQ